mmetsp:Transcript_25961/g.55570  ORF Transcript_25961/g.55570 Transcript_25961/m.55570 type:complete len:398 (+) Transcript_25961:519-1712(+)
MQSGAGPGDIATDQHHVGGFRSNVGPGAHAYSDICFCKRRGIVDTISHHTNDFPLVLKLSHLFYFRAGQRFGYDSISWQVELLGNGIRRSLAISRDHPNIHPQFFQVPNGLVGFRLDFIGNAENGAQGAIDSRENRCFAVQFELLHARFHFGRHSNVFSFGKRSIANSDVYVAIDHTRSPSTGHSHKIRGLDKRLGSQQPLDFLFRKPDDCRSQDVLRIPFQRSQQPHEEVVCRHIRIVVHGQAFHEIAQKGVRCQPCKVSHRWFAPRKSPGLVEEHRIGLRRYLQGFSTLHEDPVAGSDAGSHHDGGRSCQTKGARTTDDERRYAEHQGKGDRIFFSVPAAGHQTRLAAYPPHQKREKRKENDDGNKDRSDRIGQFLYGNLFRLCFLHHLNDLRQR